VDIRIGKVIEVNEEKGEYQIEFVETGKTKPINFEFRGLKKIEKQTELTEEEKTEKSKADEDWNSLVQSEIQIKQSEKPEIPEPEETNVEEKKTLIRKRIADLKDEKIKSELIVEPKKSEKETTKEQETEEKILSPTTYKSNDGNSAKPKEKDENNLWSKLKGLWS